MRRRSVREKHSYFATIQPVRITENSCLWVLLLHPYDATSDFLDPYASFLDPYDDRYIGICRICRASCVPISWTPEPYNENECFSSSFIDGRANGGGLPSLMFVEKSVVLWGAFDARRTARVVRALRAPVEASGTGPFYRSGPYAREHRKIRCFGRSV